MILLNLMMISMTMKMTLMVSNCDTIHVLSPPPLSLSLSLAEHLFPSLDESNWRNDYPDEEDDESDNSSCTTSSDDGDNSHYRHREPYYGK